MEQGDFHYIAKYFQISMVSGQPRVIDNWHRFVTRALQTGKLHYSLIEEENRNFEILLEKFLVHGTLRVRKSL